MSETARVAMLWPTTLKEQAKSQLGERSLTEFVIEAVEVYMGIDGDLNAKAVELQEARDLAQRLADQLVLSHEHPERRLSALTSTQFPSWIDSSGWPKGFVEQVRPAPAAAPKVGEKVEFQIAKPAKPAPEPAKPEPQEVEYEVVPTETPVVPEDPEAAEPWTPGAARKGGDLFDRVMQKTGGKLADVPGLTIASQIDPPKKEAVEDGFLPGGGSVGTAPDEEESGLYVDDDDQAAEAAINELEAGKCPICKEDLIDGECWTCG